MPEQLSSTLVKNSGWANDFNDMKVNQSHLVLGAPGVTAGVNLRGQEVTFVIFPLHLSDVHLLIVLGNTHKDALETIILPLQTHNMIQLLT